MSNREKIDCAVALVVGAVAGRLFGWLVVVVACAAIAWIAYLLRRPEDS